jgi:hypothetical protein
VPPRVLFAAIVLSSLAGAQSVSFGVVGGASVTNDFRNSIQPLPPPPGPPIMLTDYSASERYIAGAMLEFRLPQNWSIELDGLYHPLRYDSAAILPNGTLNGISPSHVITWEFPVLAKYRFRWREWRPFVEAGPSFRTAGNLNSANPSHVGIAAGAGVEAHLGKFRLAPEVRYIRWAEDNPFYVRTRPDQIELLTSFSTGVFPEGGRFLTRISVGAVAGATLSPDFRTVQESFTLINGSQTSTIAFSDSSGPRSFLVGPMVEIALAKGFFLEGDAIYRPMRSRSETDTNGEISSGSATIETWNVPVLGKYKFSVRGLKPFLEAGPSFRFATALSGSSPFGVTAGAGIETHFRRLAIAPVVRYTYWGRNSLGSAQPFRNQIEVVGGFSF